MSIVGPREPLQCLLAPRARPSHCRTGGACEGLEGEPRCGSTEELEFAHVKPTKLNGRGRGFNHRVKDVRSHPEAYRLLCKACHWFLDFGNPPELPFLPEEVEPALSEGES